MKFADISPIRSDADYQAALSQIDTLFGANPDTEEGKKLDILLVLVEDWERRQNYALPDAEPIDAIKFRMEQQNLSQRDLVPFIGSLSKVSEVLSGKRSLSLSMIRSLSKGLNIPAEILLKEPLPKVPEEIEGICQKAHCFPLKEMKKRKWFPDSAYDVKEQAEELLREWLGLLNDIKPPVSVFPKATRQTEKTDRYALFAWCVKVLLEARKIKAPNYTKGSIDRHFLEELKKLSLLTEGPKIATERLREKGIRVITEDHLPKTHLDGVLISYNDQPVIGLTLRYDRIDNFWFVLFHELAHLINDFEKDATNAVFIDDMTLDSASGMLDEVERLADETATEALIPSNEWQKEISEYTLPSSHKIIELAFKWQVNPAIIAGRLRYLHKNYRLYPDFVGTGEIRPLFKASAS
jgi:HTH-type transcriptional regulator/antitoxin HigA